MKRVCILSVILWVIPGCSSSVQLGGAYFPAWLVCMTTGLLGTMLLRLLLIRASLDQLIRPRALAYPCVALSITLITYFLFFR